jgi:hypothetical protein
LRKRFAEAFDGGRDQKVSRQLHQIRALRPLAEAECPLSDGVEDSLHALECRRSGPAVTTKDLGRHPVMARQRLLPIALIHD